MSTIIPVVMAGGTGTRLWPLSRRAAPKQFQTLVTDRTMLAETLERSSGEEYADPIIIGSGAHLEAIQDTLQGRGTVVLEPVGRNTAPAAIVAALLAEEHGPDSLVLLLPADHHITDPEAFRAAVKKAQAAAEKGYLVTLGISPDGPETGYGYIKQAEALTDSVYRVERFVEKPNRETAEGYLAEGGYTWNAGIFLYRAADLLAEAEAHAPQLLAATKAAFEAASREGGVVRLPEEEFAAVEGDSIDYAIMEKTSKAAVVSPVVIGWNDIGSWAAAQQFAGQKIGEGCIGIDCENTFIRTSADAPMVAAVGVEGLTVVATKDAVLILPTDRSQDVKRIVEELQAKGRNELL
ncbi:mannose-1-phosphate guanylyltransferase/mannose-6-phosphate isomerase [Parvularcula maris]|uniref:mannose-1-phosphate guanylyltransferase n=1 Tax=Parvularcula maris TaxID=2965077 RepID=A0A9X2L849_9PROT|nr:mannose-1-phosphate guanylyltransferase/mannose-6-phosphate isomerase [Parvularcula maris]MCQ8184850.1 mannose-1-phosphate guanylyltransferase/mannose-6-phosphate isomerase [Parvularcula maris]